MKIWPEGNLSLNDRNESQPHRPEARQRRRGLHGAPTTCSRIATRRRSCTTRRWSRASCVAAVGRRQAHGVHADRRHRQLPHRHGARSRHRRRKGPRRLPVHGRQLRQQEPEPGCGSDRRGAREGGRRAGEAGDVAQGRFHRHARPLADGAVLQGRREERRHAQAIQLRGYSGMGPYRKNSRRDRRRRALSVPEHRERRLAGLHQPDVVREFPRAGVSAGVLRHPVDDGRRRREAEDGSGRVRPEEHDAEGRRRDAVHQLHARGVHPPRRRGVRVEEAMAAEPGSDRGPIKRGAGVAFMAFRSGVGRSSAVIRVDSQGPVHACTSASPTSAPARRRRWG